jgi:hypothetical protein
MFVQDLGFSYTKIIFIIYLKFKFKWSFVLDMKCCYPPAPKAGV